MSWINTLRTSVAENNSSTDAPQPCQTVDPPSATSQAPSPFTVAPPPSPPRSPFILTFPSPVVGGPFAQHPAPPSVVTSLPDPQLLILSSAPRFLEMPLDRYVNIVTALTNDGRFSHIGHGVLRLEGQTACGVWLRINYWDSSQGRRARLRVGVLHHVGNRFSTFHGSASTVRQLLLPLFQDWTFATLAYLMWASHDLLWRPPCMRHPLPPSTPHAPSLCKAHPVPPQGCQELISLVRRLTFQLEALQTEVHGTARAAAHLHLVHAVRPLHPHPVLPPPISLHLPTLLLRLHLPLLSGLAPVVAARLPCTRSGPRDAVTLTVTVAGVLTTASLFLSPSLLLLPLALLARPARVVHQVGLLRLTPTGLVCFCSTHCTRRKCHRRSPPPVQPRCRRPDCLEPAPPDCPVRFCNLHCTSPRCVVHDPLSRNGQGAARR